MPMPEIQVASATLQLVVTGGGFAGIILTFAVTQMRISTKLDTLIEQNGKEHHVLFEKVDKLNGQGRDNRDSLVELQATCKERHKGE